MVAILNWVLAIVGIGSVASIRVEKINNKRIKKLEKHIMEAKSLGVPTDKISIQYQNAVIAADKHKEQELSAITSGE